MSKANKKKRKIGRKTAPTSSKQYLRKLRGVLGENSSAMMRLASEGASATEISERLQVDQSEAERFIQAFTQLPCGIDNTLLRAPSLLSKHKEMKSILKAAIRSAR